MSDSGKYSNCITLIGSGNIAWHLGVAFANKGVQIKQVVARNKQEGEALANQLQSSHTTQISKTNLEVDLVVIAVNDAAIGSVVSNLPKSNAVIAHTSGSVSIEEITCCQNKAGVLYPLQTFSKNVETGKLSFPVCIEAGDENSISLLKKYASMLSNTVKELKSEQRKRLHVSAVLANNFTNHLLTRAFDYLKANSIPEKLLISILNETLRKAATEGPQGAQTGPAIRGDSEVQKKHIALLQDFPELQEIYKVMSASIEAYYSKD